MSCAGAEAEAVYRDKSLGSSFSFAEEVSSAAMKTILPLASLMFVLMGINIFGLAMSGDYGAALFFLGFLVLAGIAGYLFYRYKTPVSVEIAGSTLYVNSLAGGHIKELPLCGLDMEILIPVKKTHLEEFIEKDYKVFVVIRSNGMEDVDIARGLFAPGLIPMKKLIEFQHWVIEHIKENCPEEIYKEAVKYRIGADIRAGRDSAEKREGTKPILYVVLGTTLAFSLLFLAQIILILLLLTPLIVTARVFSLFSLAVGFFSLFYMVKKGNRLTIALGGMAALFGLVSVLFAFVL